jgi:hypothetical protein
MTCGMVSNKKDGTWDTWDISYKFGWHGTWNIQIEQNTTVDLQNQTLLHLD